MTLPDHTRHAREAARAIGADFHDLDAGEGSLFRISRGGRAIVLGAGSVSAFPLNTAASFSIARDKAYTKAALQSIGLPVIEGRLFFATARRAALRRPGREASDAAPYAARLGWPVFAKPNTGSRGDFAEIISSAADLADYIERIAPAYEAFLIERLVAGDEYRVLVKDGVALFAARKAAPCLIGDGTASIAALFEGDNARLGARALSTHRPSALALSGETAPHRIPANGERIPLAGRRNLSSAGDIDDFTLTPAPPLARLAIASVQAIGLRFGGVDIFDSSPRQDLSQLVVIEVNGNPGLKTLELQGRADLVLDLWRGMLEEALSVAAPV
ncbi:hypothetical protein GC169_07475 [bacterium]|nr:hypothetical protein [bacterium]